MLPKFQITCGNTKRERKFAAETPAVVESQDQETCIFLQNAVNFF